MRSIIGTLSNEKPLYVLASFGSKKTYEYKVSDISNKIKLIGGYLRGEDSSPHIKEGRLATEERIHLDPEQCVIKGTVDTPYGDNSLIYIKTIYIDREYPNPKEINRITSIDLSECMYEIILDEVGDLLGHEAPSRKEQNKLHKKGKKSMKFGKMNIKGFENIGMKEGLFGYSFFTNQMAVKTEDGYFSYDKKNRALEDVSGFVMDMPIPAMIMPAKRSELKAGDMLMHQDEVVFVSKDVEEGSTSIHIVRTNGDMDRVTKVANPMFKEVDFVEKITNPFGDMNFGGDGGGDFASNPMMMMALMGGDSEESFGGSGSSKMMEMMMMSSMMKAMSK